MPLAGSQATATGQGARAPVEGDLMAAVVVSYYSGRKGTRRR